MNSIKEEIRNLCHSCSPINLTGFEREFFILFDEVDLVLYWELMRRIE